MSGKSPIQALCPLNGIQNHPVERKSPPSSTSVRSTESCILVDNPPSSAHLSTPAPLLVDKHTFIPAFQSARRISEPWRPLRCRLSRFCNCFSAATPTKRLCDRLRSGLFLVFGHFYAAKRISGLRRGFRCQAAAGYNNSRHYRIHPSTGGWYVDTLEHEVTELVGIFPALTSRP